MLLKVLFHTVCLFFVFVSVNSNAMLIKTGEVTLDTATGYEWLNLTVTSGMSYNDVTAMIGVGGAREGQGWAYASNSLVDGLWASAGYTPFSTGQLDGAAAKTLLNSWGVLGTVTDSTGTDAGTEYRSDYLVSDENQFTANLISTVFYKEFDDPVHGLDGGFRNTTLVQSKTQMNNHGRIASALYRVASNPVAVPVPSVVWLFGIGLIGLIGFKKHKKA